MIARLLEAYGLRRQPIARDPVTALRMRRYRARKKGVTQRNATVTKRNAASLAKRNGSVTHSVTGVTQPFLLPDWIPTDQWDAWIEARTKHHKAPTVWAMKLALIKLEHLKNEGHSVSEILANSAFNGWTGLFPPKGH